jgi:hypothetical protein
MLTQLKLNLNFRFATFGECFCVRIFGLVDHSWSEIFVAEKLLPRVAHSVDKLQPHTNGRNY